MRPEASRHTMTDASLTKISRLTMPRSTSTRAFRLPPSRLPEVGPDIVLSSLATVLPRVPLTIAPGRPARKRAHGAGCPGRLDAEPLWADSLAHRARTRTRSSLRYSRVTPREALS